MKTKASIRKALPFLLIVSLCICAIGFIMDCFRGTTPPESVGSVRLNIETYLAGANQPTHPSVVSFETPWNGYSYWMAYSPYPYANGEEENPCVAASNDLGIRANDIQKINYLESITELLNNKVFYEKSIKNRSLDLLS